ncbi:G2/M phase-specific E3 ubiquitin-protein ligase [Collichthys lucidus]|uniref:G2/M phase-specific E3 ubiquitin-protein ligase n=1 Tax=Collichthys lucidus TaxID=240159 RepID=A0A4U5V7W3_COLLU|nr:G2/M phase-specific E3 ubiquitin-protein ligase [Collichthys lucidus]
MLTRRSYFTVSGLVYEHLAYRDGYAYALKSIWPEQNCSAAGGLKEEAQEWTLVSSLKCCGKQGEYMAATAESDKDEEEDEDEEDEEEEERATKCPPAEYSKEERAEVKGSPCIIQEEKCVVIHLDEDDAYPGTSGCLDVKSSCYRNYTNLFSPIVIDDEDDEDEVVIPEEINNMPSEESEPTSVQAPEIIANLALAIDHKKVSRFNISRSNVWDGAVRGFRRSSYSDNSDIFVKFADDAGSYEDGLDTGGPRREFLTLLMNHLRNRPIFDGPPERRYLVYNSTANRCWRQRGQTGRLLISRQRFDLRRPNSITCIETRPKVCQ